MSQENLIVILSIEKKNIYKNYIVMLQLKSEKVNLKYF